VLLHTVIYPPRHVLDAVAEVVRSAGAAPVGELPTTRSFLRRGGRQSSGPAVVSTLPEQLRLIAPEDMTLPIAGFGNVTSADAIRLSKALQTAAHNTPGATVRLAGGTALEFPEDRNVWARLEGDVDGLRSMSRDVTKVVEQLGFFVDRRRFRPWLCVASVTATTTPAVLENVVAALDAFSGEPWTVDHVWLMKAFFGSQAAEFEELGRFPLAPPAP